MVMANIEMMPFPGEVDLGKVAIIVIDMQVRFSFFASIIRQVRRTFEHCNQQVSC